MIAQNEPASTITGYVDSRFERVSDEFVSLLQTGRELGAGLTVIFKGETVVSLVGGWRDRARTSPWRKDTVVNTFSVGKAVVAVALLILVDRGEIELDEPVASYWPEFGVNGKQVVTIRHLLSHQAGIPGFPSSHPAAVALDWAALTKDLAGAELEWAPGTAHGEHIWTYGHLIGEVIRRVDGRLPSQFVQEELAGPWDLDFDFGARMPEQAIAELETKSSDWPSSLRGDPGSLTQRIRATPVGWLDVDFLNGSIWRQSQVPAGNLHATATACARSYAGLLNGGELNGVKLLSPELVEQMITPHTEGPDLVLQRPVRWGLGIQIEPEFGEWGMGGIGGSCAAANPIRSYSLGYVTRYLDGHDRVTELIDVINKCIDDGTID